MTLTPTASVRDPDRPSAVGGGSEGHHLCGDGGTRATAGAARGLRHFIVFSMESIIQEVGINRVFSFSMEKSKGNVGGLWYLV